VLRAVPPKRDFRFASTCGVRSRQSGISASLRFAAGLFFSRIFRFKTYKSIVPESHIVLGQYFIVLGIIFVVLQYVFFAFYSLGSD
jgi:hypothetical protein